MSITVADLTITQPILDAVFVGIVITGYALESRRVRAATAPPLPRASRARDATPRS